MRHPGGFLWQLIKELSTLILLGQKKNGRIKSRGKYRVKRV